MNAPSPQNGSQPMLNVSVSPHVRYGESVRSVMVCVVIALLPALAVSAYFYGPRVLIVTAVSVIAAILTEWVLTALMRRPRSIGDFSAVVTGLLVAYNVPPNVVWWIPALGSVFAIAVAKMAFGGLGHNFINPALAGRAFLMASYPIHMTTFTFTQEQLRRVVVSGIDGVSSATPLAHMKDALAAGTFQALDFQEALGSLFWGNVGGCLGETSVAALLLGAGFLWHKHMLSFRIPFAYIATVFLLFWLLGPTGNPFTSDGVIVAVYHVLSGGLMLGALFMATDMVTSPITPWGKVLFGFGCGVLTYAIRRFGGYPEGVSYSILLMNCVAPLLDRYTKPRIYGEVKRG